jgi:integrase
MLRAVSTLPQWVRSVYAVHRLGIKPATVDAYCYACLALERWAGRALLPRDFCEDLILGFLNARLQNRSAKTVHRERQTLLTLWQFAHERGEAAPVPKLPRIKVPRQIPTAWRLDELTALLGATARLQIGQIAGIPRHLWWRSLLLFLYDTGARIGAGLAIRRADVSLPDGWAALDHEHSKTGVAQLVSLSPQTVEALRRIWGDRELVWPWPFHRRTLWAQYRRIRKWAGLPTDRSHAFHCLRKTHASHLAVHDLEAARRSLGHTSSAITLALYVDPRILSAARTVDLLPRPKL